MKGFLESTEGREVRQLLSDLIFREGRFRVQLPGGLATVVVGVVDLAYEGEGGWKIVEYKTGEPLHETRELHMDQTRVYAAGLQHDRGLEVSNAVIAYLSRPEKMWVRFSPRAADLSMNKIAGIAEACSRGEFPPQPARDRCGACPYGGRGGICPERHRPPKVVGNR